MTTDLMPWLIAWAALTTAVIVLALYRTMVVAHEVTGGVHLSGDPTVIQEQKHTARVLAIVDFWGKTLTILSVALILMIACIWGYHTYLKAYEVIGH